ncbi:MAG TPA: hypothetical protein VGM62_05550 [Chthoniobacterales bacterium]
MSKATFAIAASVCLGLISANAAERENPREPSLKQHLSSTHRTSSIDDSRGGKPSHKQTARNDTKHRKSTTAGRKSTNRNKSKISETRRDNSGETLVSILANEANNRVTLPRQENEIVSEIENGQKIDDASGNLMGINNQNEDQDDGGD